MYIIKLHTSHIYQKKIHTEGKKSIHTALINFIPFQQRLVQLTVMMPLLRLAFQAWNSPWERYKLCSDILVKLFVIYAMSYHKHCYSTNPNYQTDFKIALRSPYNQQYSRRKYIPGSLHWRLEISGRNITSKIGTISLTVNVNVIIENTRRKSI